MVESFHCAELSCGQSLERLKGFCEACAVFTAGCGDIALATATALDKLGSFADLLACVLACGHEVVRVSQEQTRLALKLICCNDCGRRHLLECGDCGIDAVTVYAFSTENWKRPSAEVNAMAISAFEDAFVANVVDAMTVAIEKAILAGTGTTGGQPTGILTQTVPTGQTITLADTTTHIPTYAELVAAEAALPVEYENTAKWFMTKKQFMAFVGMVDDNGQPIARVDYGFENRPVRRLLGREVIVHPYATEMGQNVAAIYDFRDYMLNTIYDLGIQRQQDWDTEDYLTKAVMSVDGKPVSNASLVVMQ